MSAAPRRRPLRRDDLDVETTLKRASAAAPEIELGWSVLRQEMRNAGWATQIPEGDRSPATDAQNGQSDDVCIDYADTTGEKALRFASLANDLDALQDHWHLVATSLRAMALIARKHIPTASPALPACSVTSCDGTVEPGPGGSYRGMERIAGMWVAKPGVRPVCAKHRTQDRRAS